MLPNLQEFAKFTAQNSNLLNNKELNVADALCEKALDELRTSERIDFKEVLLKFTSAFFRLFVNCPTSLAEGLTKKCLSLLRELHQLRGNQRQKYDYLILALLDVTQKCYIRPFCQTQKGMSLVSGANRQQVLSFGMKGGSSLIQVLSLLRKVIQREKQWTNRIYSLTECLFDAYKNEIGGFLRHQETSQRKRSYFKLVAMQQLVEMLKSRFQKQIYMLLNQNLQTYMAESQPNNKQVLGLFVFIQLREDKIDFDYLQQNCTQLKGQFGKRDLDSVLAYGLLSQLVQLGQGRGSMKAIRKIMLLYGWQVDSSKLQSPVLWGKQLALWGLKIAQRLQLYKRQFSKTFSYRELITVFTAERAKKPEIHSVFNPLEESHYRRISSLELGNEELKVVLALICWSISVLDVQNQVVQTQAQSMLCQSLKKTLSQFNSQNPMKSRSFWKNMYLSFSFHLSVQSFLKELFEKPEKGRTDLGLIGQIYQGLPLNYLDYDQTTVSELKRLSNRQPVSTIQTLIDLFSILFQPNMQPTLPETLDHSLQLTSLSLVFYQKLSIRPSKQRHQRKPEVSFESSYKKNEVQKALSLLWYLYCKEEQLGLKQEKRQMSEAIQGEKVVVSALRKYFSLQYGKISENIIKKWVLNRQYLVIWCMLLCSYKVKSICEQLLKCDIPRHELLTVFQVQPIIVGHFVQYLCTKDKYKFRLRLFQQQQLEQLSLLDSSIPTLLRKPITHQQSKQS